MNSNRSPLYILAKCWHFLMTELWAFKWVTLVTPLCWWPFQCNKSVINISNLSPTLLSSIRHQHRCFILKWHNALYKWPMWCLVKWPQVKWSFYRFDKFQWTNKNTSTDVTIPKVQNARFLVIFDRSIKIDRYEDWPWRESSSQKVLFSYPGQIVNSFP